jgi:cytochrome c peroxidase
LWVTNRIVDEPSAEESTTLLSPQALQEIARVEAEIDRIEAQTIERLAAPPDNQVQQIELLGKLLLYDKQLSVNRNEACAFCHMPETGFTGPVSELNRTTGSYPGSVRTRFSNRKPQSHAYAPLSPVLHYNPGQGDLVGGNFWDMRATGRRLGNPAAEQAEGPPTNPVEGSVGCQISKRKEHPGQIERDLHVSRKVVRKVIRSDATEFHYERSRQPLPKIGPWRDRLDALLVENEEQAIFTASQLDPDTCAPSKKDAYELAKKLSDKSARSDHWPSSSPSW